MNVQRAEFVTDSVARNLSRAEVFDVNAGRKLGLITCTDWPNGMRSFTAYAYMPWDSAETAMVLSRTSDGPERETVVLNDAKRAIADFWRRNDPR